ncbi:restriction endonuclease [Calidifontibacillus oryziterrae]|uniref:restriction endonuclease n=1 Tax=Calidifontibacillus oryziterrae TaxID=1191699 RepID=UPI0002FA61BA|nr:restriction endonuclease [Calidifontibacillus oryziterrae]
MNKTNRKNLASLVSGLFAIICLYLFFIVFKSTNYFIFFGIILCTAIINELVNRLLPKKKRNTLSTKKIATKQQSATNTYSTSNLLRSDEEILKIPLQELSWREFERLCYLYFKTRGYKPKETSEGKDGGVDLILFDRHHDANIAVQIKHYINSSNQITVKEIRELNSSKRNHNCMLAMFITNSTYTNDALQQADKFKIDCKDINWVENHILKWQQKEAKKRT